METCPALRCACRGFGSVVQQPLNEWQAGVSQRMTHEGLVRESFEVSFGVELPAEPRKARKPVQGSINETSLTLTLAMPALTLTSTHLTTD